jgi:hypothetical protein
MNPLYNQRESHRQPKEETMEKQEYIKIRTVETKEEVTTYPHELFSIQEAAEMCDMSPQGIDYRVAHKSLPIYYEPAIRLRGAMVHIDDIRRIRRERGLSPDPDSGGGDTTTMSE